MLNKNKVEEVEKQPRRISIDWGRQGGVIIGYLITFFGFHGIIANTMLFDEFGFWISYEEMNRTIIFWTYTTFLSSYLSSTLFISILIILLILIIVFSLKEWHSTMILTILIPLYVFFVLDLYWNLFNIITVITLGNFYFTIQGFTVVLLFFVCFALTYKEEIPQYGIKASIWLVPLIVFLSFIFYGIMFGISIEPFILQFASAEGWINILILVLTVLSGSLSGMRVKKVVVQRKEIELD